MIVKGASQRRRRATALPLRHFPNSALLLVMGLALLPALAQGQAAPDPTDLKKLSVEELMDIEVTSVSKHPEKISDTASAIQVVTSEDIASSGATNIPEALRLASNLEVAQIDSRQWAITARGFNNEFADKMLVLVDGRTVYTPLYGGVYWDVQDTLMEDLDRIEVISGPGATQWGANAVNGVINITTKSSRDTQGGLLYGDFGTTLQDGIGVRYGGEVAPGVFYRVYAKYFDEGDSLLENGRTSNDSWRIGQTGFRSDWYTQGGDLVTLQGDAYVGATTKDVLDNTHMSGANVLSRWSHATSANSDIKLQIYYDNTYRAIPDSFTQNLGTYDIDFQQNIRTGGGHNIVWGLGYRLVDDDIANTPAEAFLPADVANQWFSAFAQDKITLLGDHLHLTVGSKIEHNDYTGFEVEPSGRIAWTPGPTQTIWTAVSRAVREPSRADVDLYEPASPPYRIAGGPNVVSEVLIAYELGYRVKLDRQVALSIASYFNDYNNLRSLDPLNPPNAFPVEISSGVEGRSEGVELTADWTVTPDWRIRAGWTEMRVTSEPNPGSDDRNSNRSLSDDPNHQASLRSTWDLSRRWQFFGDMRYVAAINNQSVPSYVEADARIAWRPFEAWEFSVTGQNLVHSQHAEFNAPGSRREIPRSVYEKTSWRF